MNRTREITLKKTQLLFIPLSVLAFAGIAFASTFVATSLNNVVVGGQWSQTASIVRNEITGNQRGNFPLICFPPVSLVSGQYYDIVVQNVDQNPSLNWSSLDFLWDAGFDNQTPDVQVWLRDGEGAAFKPGDGGTFIGSPVALFYADGVIQGHGDIAVSSTSASWLQCGSAYGFPAALCQ